MTKNSLIQKLEQLSSNRLYKDKTVNRHANGLRLQILDKTDIDDDLWREIGLLAQNNYGDWYDEDKEIMKEQAKERINTAIDEVLAREKMEEKEELQVSKKYFELLKEMTEE